LSTHSETPSVQLGYGTFLFVMYLGYVYVEVSCVRLLTMLFVYGEVFCAMIGSIVVDSQITDTVSNLCLK
jgi:hypothetical protein